MFTEAGRELADPAGVAALAIRRMSVGALGPVPGEDRIWPGRRGSNLIKIDGWTLPGPCGPTLRPRHFWTHFGSLLEDRFGTHFWSISEAVSGLILELIWSA